MMWSPRRDPVSRWRPSSTPRMDYWIRAGRQSDLVFPGRPSTNGRQPMGLGAIVCSIGGRASTPRPNPRIRPSPGQLSRLSKIEGQRDPRNSKLAVMGGVALGSATLETPVSEPERINGWASNVMWEASAAALLREECGLPGPGRVVVHRFKKRRARAGVAAAQW